MTDRKTVRLDKLTPETRELVEKEVELQLGEDRLEKLLAGNDRLLDAFAAVWEPEDDHGDGVATAILQNVMRVQRPGREHG